VVYLLFKRTVTVMNRTFVLSYFFFRGDFFSPSFIIVIVLIGRERNCR
jgi:hypothetical protein